MPERHRSNPRDFDRDRGRGYGGRGDFGGPGGDRGGRGGPGNTRPGPPPRGDRPPYDPQAMHRDNRPPAPPEEMDEFEDVEAQLAVAIIQAATKLTEIVGATGLPENYTERREAVVESFETIYFALLDAITGSDDEEEDEGE